PREPYDVGDTVGVRLFLDRLQLGELGLVGRDNELAAALVRHAVPGAVLVEEGLAFHAGARLQGSLRIVDAGMDDFRIARAGVGADGLLRLEDDDLAALQGKRTRDGQADHARAEHYRINAFHGGSFFRSGTRPPRRGPRRTSRAAPCPRRAGRARC